MSSGSFDDWLELGAERGFCSDSFCSTHDLGPMSDDEVAEVDDGGDPCVVVVRLYRPSDALKPDSASPSEPGLRKLFVVLPPTPGD